MLPDVRSTFALPFPLDLGLTLAPLRHGGTDPTIQVEGDDVWRTGRTPAGPATLQFSARYSASGGQCNFSPATFLGWTVYAALDAGNLW